MTRNELLQSLDDWEFELVCLHEGFVNGVMRKVGIETQATDAEKEALKRVDEALGDTLDAVADLDSLLKGEE